MKKATLLLIIFSCVLFTNSQAAETLVIDNYITIQNADGFTEHDSAGVKTYNKSGQYGTFAINAKQYKNPFYSLVLGSKTNIHNRYNDVYIDVMNKLGNTGTPALSTVYSTYQGFDICDLYSHQTNYNPELWTRLILIKSKIYSFEYYPNADNNSAKAEYNTFCNSVTITNCEPNAQLVRGNIDFSETKSWLIIIAVIAGLLTLVWLAGRRWRKPKIAA
jgi:hypothetical protein